jgi:hypothetical protein
VADETAHPHRYVRRRDPVLGEWCAMCGRNEWDELHTPRTVPAEQDGADR